MRFMTCCDSTNSVFATTECIDPGRLMIEPTLHTAHKAAWNCGRAFGQLTRTTKTGMIPKAMSNLKQPGGEGQPNLQPLRNNWMVQHIYKCCTCTLRVMTHIPHETNKQTQFPFTKPEPVISWNQVAWNSQVAELSLKTSKRELPVNRQENDQQCCLDTLSHRHEGISRYAKR